MGYFLAHVPELAGTFLYGIGITYCGALAFGTGQFGSIILLWFYSTNLKKQLLIGNVLISLLTAWVLLIIFFSKYPLQIRDVLLVDHDEVRFFRFTVSVCIFCFYYFIDP
jgi:4-hydroxybenzoate polyprenyltransferase